MALKKDKQKVLGETFSEQRVKEFLEVKPIEENDVDYIALERAYRGMKADNFATFVKFFVDEGRNINAQNHEGKTLLQIISKHRHAGNYISALKAAGAN